MLDIDRFDPCLSIVHLFWSDLKGVEFAELLTISRFFITHYIL
jgi:hypothetical protein